MRTIDKATARRVLVGAAGLGGVQGHGGDGVRAMLARRRCVQLDPLDPMGTNADLVALARVDGIEAGDVYDHLLPGHAFEHFAKERCLLPASAFPNYRDRAVHTPWWRAGAREKRLDEAVLADVLAEVRARGPVATADLTDRGRVDPLSWHGWKSTAKRTTMAVEVLWRRCGIVVCGRSTKGKVIDVPERALPEVAEVEPAQAFDRWAVQERAAAAGLLSRAGGVWWSVLYEIRKTDLPDRLVAEGILEEVAVEGSRRVYLVPAGWIARDWGGVDERMRIVGPLDPMIWDRKLVQHAFGFEYLWEVYKPEAKRRWGWYVCPLLWKGALVGRIEARKVEGELRVSQVWWEDRALDDPLDAALARHAKALGCARVVR